MSYKADKATELAVANCERLTTMRPDWRWSEEYRRYYDKTVAQINQIRYRPGLATQLRRRMAKARPVAPPEGYEAATAVDVAEGAGA